MTKEPHHRQPLNHERCPYCERTLLTRRELEVLQLLCQGLPAARIAARLSITHGTVKLHLQGLYRKLAVHSAPACIAEAYRQDLVLPERHGA